MGRTKKKKKKALDILTKIDLLEKIFRRSKGTDTLTINKHFQNKSS